MIFQNLPNLLVCSIWKNHQKKPLEKKKTKPCSTLIVPIPIVKWHFQKTSNPGFRLSGTSLLYYPQFCRSLLAASGLRRRTLVPKLAAEAATFLGKLK